MLFTKNSLLKLSFLVAVILQSLACMDYPEVAPLCPASIEIEGKEYKTAFFHGPIVSDDNSNDFICQCWMAENLNKGIPINSAASPIEDTIAQKYCWDNNPANCDAMGGLYSWHEAMNYSSIEGSQGVCPTGWHIPTDEEWKTLERYFGMSFLEANTFEWRDGGDDPNAKENLKRETELNETPGFNINQGLGYLDMGANSGFFGNENFRERRHLYWTSSSYDYNSMIAMIREVRDDKELEVFRNNTNKLNGLYIRCLQD